MEKLAPEFKALSDKTRLKIMELLVEGNYCVKALAEELGVSESAVSQHLKKLREAGLVVGRKKSYWVHYSVRTESLKELAGKLEEWADRSEKDGQPCCQKV